MIDRCRRVFVLLPATVALWAAVGPAVALAYDSAAPAGAVAQSENSFGFALLQAVDDHRANVFVSPLSIGQAMTMLYDGAGGVTRDQIGKAMRLDGLDAAAVDAGAGALRSGISDADPNVDLAIANALWADNSVEFRSSYAQTCLNVFGAQATSLDFKDPSAAATINSWVSRNTKGHITSIVSANSIHEAGAVLTDAVYFHGSWSHAFDPGDTQDGPFTLASGDTKQLPMMEQTHRFSSIETDSYQAVALPYGAGRISMVIVLPRTGKSLDSIASALTGDSWQDLKSSMVSNQVDITLPRFHVDYSTSLVDGLKSMGIADAFDRHAADFQPMSDTPMYVSAVVHKTTLDVDEAGTTATAATGITMMPMMAMPVRRPPIVIRVDHPFICAIQDNQTGALLFIGLIRDPATLAQ
jgi:serine protease inhibitor